MAIRDIRVVPDPVLRTPCETITNITPAVRRLVTDLLETVDDPGRAGLSANQIGVSLRAFSFNIEGKLGYVLNPVIEETSGSSMATRDVSPCQGCGIRHGGLITHVFVASTSKARKSYLKAVV